MPLRLEELPRWLLQQKPRLNLGRFDAWAQLVNRRVVYAYEIQRQDRPICCFWFVLDPLYQQVIFDTFVVDEPERSDETTGACVLIAKEVAKQVAKFHGFNRIVVPSPIPERFLELAQEPEAKVTEYVITWEFEE